MKAINADGAIDAANAQIRAIRRAQRAAGKAADPDAIGDLTSQVGVLLRALAAYQAELRKTGEDAEKALEGMPAQRIAQLALRLVSKLSPEHRAAVALHIQELDGKLIDHGGAQ